MKSDAELNQVLEIRYFNEDTDNLIESILSKASQLKQEKNGNEFTSILRNVILPEPKLTLPLFLAASFLIGIFTNTGIESNLANEITDLMYYGGELL